MRNRYPCDGTLIMRIYSLFGNLSYFDKNNILLDRNMVDMLLNDIRGKIMDEEWLSKVVSCLVNTAYTEKGRDYLLMNNIMNDLPNILEILPKNNMLLQKACYLIQSLSKNENVSTYFNNELFIYHLVLMYKQFSNINEIAYLLLDSIQNIVKNSIFIIIIIREYY